MGRDVHVLCVCREARAVSSLLARQLGQDQEAAAAVTTHFVSNSGDVSAVVGKLASSAATKHGVRVIVDEADSGR